MLSDISKYWINLENDLNVSGFLTLIDVGGGNKRYLLNDIGKEFFEFIKYDEVTEE